MYNVWGLDLEKPSTCLLWRWDERWREMEAWIYTKPVENVEKTTLGRKIGGIIYSWIIYIYLFNFWYSRKIGMFTSSLVIKKKLSLVNAINKLS